MDWMLVLYLERTMPSPLYLIVRNCLIFDLVLGICNIYVFLRSASCTPIELMS